ncbi:MAG TPA: ATP-binding cassette domain-containing protein, partial [Coriobacteriia bacterium]|nr:ATP-binding cassette domain-containing protein [Coriobacteriia bacterium]
TGVQNLNVTDRDNPGRFVVNGLSLEVRAGEIVCLYGLMGAGRTELLEAIAGREPITGGEVLLEGKSILNLSIAERIERGLGLVPEDRQRDGLIQTFDVGPNLTLSNLKTVLRFRMLSRPAEQKMASELIRDVTIKTPGLDVPVGSLSGGNQQKVVIGKALATGPRVMLLDEPSRGIDVGAKEEVFRLLADRARQGLAVLFSTSEVGECLSVPHRTIVLRRGQISAEFGTDDATKEQIMAASGESVAA